MTAIRTPYTRITDLLLQQNTVITVDSCSKLAQQQRSPLGYER